MHVSIAEREQFRSLSAAKLRKVESKTKEFILFFCRDGVSFKSLSKRRYLMKGLLLFLLINPTQGFAGVPNLHTISRQLSKKRTWSHKMSLTVP